MPRYALLRAERLDLYCLTAEELELAELIDRPFANPHGVYSTENLPRVNRVADVREHPKHIRWYYRIMVDRARKQAVGSISFHAPPDATGMVEIGLGVAEAERGKGYAAEALAAMWDWACTQSAVKTLRYTVSPDNAASIALIAKFGFPLVGQQVDDEDGIELIFELSADEYRASRGISPA